MIQPAYLETFLRKTLGVDPGSQVADELRKLASTINVQRGCMAPIDHSRAMLVYVAHGATKLVASASRDREQIVAFHFGGDLISVPENGLHAFGLTALIESTLIVFPLNAMIDCAQGERSIMRLLLERAQTALYRCRDKAVGLGRKNAQERLAAFLIGMTERIESVQDDSYVIDLPMSRRDIGDSLGLTIETVSRQFSELRNAGLIETEGRSRVLLRDPGALARRAGHI